MGGMVYPERMKAGFEVAGEAFAIFGVFVREWLIHHCLIVRFGVVSFHPLVHIHHRLKP